MNGIPAVWMWLWWSAALALAFGIACLSVARRAVDVGAADARFARRSDLRPLRRRHGWFPLGYVPAGPIRKWLWRTARSDGLRNVLTRSLLRLPDEDLARHVLVVGLTGAGKTAGITMPALLDAARNGISVVAFDLKHGEDDSLARAVPAWRRAGRDVWTFAPLDVGSLRWNPLEGCKSLGAATRIAAMLFEDIGGVDPGEAYWIGAERHICAVLILAAATDGGAGTLGRVRELCEAGPDTIRAYVHDHHAASALESHLGAYRAMLPKDEAGILQGIAARLEPWSDDAVCRATGTGGADDRIDLGRLRREPVLFLVGIPQASLGRLRPLWQLFLRDLTSHLLRPRLANESVRVLAMLEELPAWGIVPGLADHLATMRSRQISVFATIQSEAQGELVYGRIGWAAVAANLVTKLYARPLADLDAERLSRALGATTASDVSRSRTWGDEGPRDAEHRRALTVPLSRPEQLQGIDVEDDEILLRCARLRPARLWCPPVHTRPAYRGLVLSHPVSPHEIAVYHRLWLRHSHTVTPNASAARVPVSETVGQPAGAEWEAPQGVPEPDFEPAVTAAPTPGVEAMVARDPGADDVATLRGLIAALLERATGPSMGPIRVVRRAGRLVELRADPQLFAALCGGPDRLHLLIRRWVELRWVRRARPVLVLERRAIEAAAADELPLAAEASPSRARQNAEMSDAKIGVSGRERSMTRPSEPK